MFFEGVLNTKKSAKFSAFWPLLRHAKTNFVAFATICHHTTVQNYTLENMLKKIWLRSQPVCPQKSAKFSPFFDSKMTWKTCPGKRKGASNVLMLKMTCFSREFWTPKKALKSAKFSPFLTPFLEQLCRRVLCFWVKKGVKKSAKFDPKWPKFQGPDEDL